MNDDAAINVIWLLGALTLVGAALLRRRIAQRGMVRLALIWIGIIVAAWAAVVLSQRYHETPRSSQSQTLHNIYYQT